MGQMVVQGGLIDGLQKPTFFVTVIMSLETYVTKNLGNTKIQYSIIRKAWGC